MIQHSPLPSLINLEQRIMGEFGGQFSPAEPLTAFDWRGLHNMSLGFRSPPPSSVTVPALTLDVVSARGPRRLLSDSQIQL
ncbi:hypothetical protein CgunFtcFv8_007752 [Champsocephalus gunnari]|uniref:Uncharacterized protein n=1 Tax=Champsocephalus gunnari TaxID=52237 RepID=A0AAN8H619_CHAGU|nr:hypothetical protein CgunFtcFv8_007752 [Champsocephalus gunnari]